MTPQEKEVLKLALEALRKARRKVLTTEECHAVIMSIKEALAQPEPEPCDMKEMCIGCSPRNADGSCPDAPRKPLTENEIKHLWYEACQTNLELTSQLIVHLAKAIEAAHGIKE